MKSFESRLTIFLSYSLIQRARARARSFVIVSLHQRKRELDIAGGGGPLGRPPMAHKQFGAHIE